MRGSPSQFGILLVFSSRPSTAMYPIIQLLEEPAWPRPQSRVRKSDLLRRVFETFLQRCIREGLVDGEAFAIDASLIKADPNRQKGSKARRGTNSDRAGGRRIYSCARRCGLRRCDRCRGQVRWPIASFRSCALAGRPATSPSAVCVYLSGGRDLPLDLGVKRSQRTSPLRPHRLGPPAPSADGAPRSLILALLIR